MVRSEIKFNKNRNNKKGKKLSPHQNNFGLCYIFKTQHPRPLHKALVTSMWKMKKDIACAFDFLKFINLHLR